jgi:DNA-binding response OmpR family regulator
MARVLVVEDDTAALELRKRVVERAGHAVAVAADAPSARVTFVEFRPEIVVLDLRLPYARDGLSLIRDFRASYPNVRIVVLCGLASDIDTQPERELVAEVLEKPIRSERLIAAISGAA